MADSLDLGHLAAQHERLRRLARALTWDEHAAEDLTQGAWVLALERGPREQGALGGWLARVTRRLASNVRRSHRRREGREREAARPEALPSSAEIAARVELEARLYAALRTQLEREGLGGDDGAERVHWVQALSPLVLGPRPVSPPPGDLGPLVTAGTAHASGLSLAAALAALVTMKLFAVIAIAAVLGFVLWGGSGSSPEVTRPTSALGPAGGSETLALASPSNATPEARLFSVSRPYLAPFGDPEPMIRVEVFPLDARVAGRVLGPDGEPVLDARVWTAAREIRTLADGRFSLPATSRRWNWVRATAEGLGMTEHPIESVLPGATVELELRLGLGARITGTVADELGRPLQGVEVRVAGDSAATVTDYNGRYVLAHVDASKGARALTVWARRACCAGS